MSYVVINEKKITRQIKDLARMGKKKIVQAVRAAQAEAAMDGQIDSLPRTKHGESRLPNVEKYDLPEAYRLVVQLVDGVKKIRAFLFVGNHEDAERWLDSHRNYRWVKKDSDGRLEFVQVTEQGQQGHIPADRVDLDRPEAQLAVPLLSALSDDEWSVINPTEEARDFAKTITADDYETDANGLLSRLTALGDEKTANILWDLCYHAYNREWSEFHTRLAVDRGGAQVAADAEVAPAMQAVENSETFLTFDDSYDIDQFFENAESLADWMLFLHPSQRDIVVREFKGPARLRGVSGSGKTSVLIHRARHLAKKYGEPVLLITLTESMRRLLDRLADDLCGVERQLISTSTVSAFSKEILAELHPRGLAAFTQLGSSRQTRLVAEAMDEMVGHKDFHASPLASWDAGRLRAFFVEELTYVRGRLAPQELDQYTSPKEFKRVGRGVALGEPARRAVLVGLRTYAGLLEKKRVVDHEELIHVALTLMDGEGPSFSRYRCVLCDEVQDLSQLEMAMLARVQTPDATPLAKAPDGLFLAGDGAQTIYKKGFSLRSLGVDITGRSLSLKKNYRNTNEILRAAFRLVSDYEFADVDEENVAKPFEPDFAQRHGARPLLMKCRDQAAEADAVAGSVESLLAMNHPAGQICVIGPSRHVRDAIRSELQKRRIEVSELREDVDYESERVKISTIESAKGHEFGTVYIAGLVEGALPRRGTEDDEIPREAARLYVAMTRARDQLVLSYAGTRNYPPSRFLVSIQPECDEARFEGGELRPLRE